MAIVLTEELTDLRRELLDMAGFVEQQYAAAVTALRGRTSKRPRLSGDRMARSMSMK